MGLRIAKKSHSILFILVLLTSFVPTSLVQATPLQQWKQGSTPVEIDCAEGKFLMINPEDEKPACLYVSSSMIRFAQNGWMPVRNAVIENLTETIISGHGGDFAKKYFSYFEIHNENTILLHSYQDKMRVSAMHTGEKVITNCFDMGGSSEITLFTLDVINTNSSTVKFTQEKQIWPEGFCDEEDSILDSYYQKLFS